MRHRFMRVPSASTLIAIIALIVALTGSALAAGLVGGDKLIKRNSLSGNRLRNHTVTGQQINLRKLGTVPSASQAKTAAVARHAASADSATNANHATSADSAASASQLGGLPPSAFQSRVGGSCTASSGIEQVNADGTVACGQVRFYSGRLVTALNASPTTFLTIPGVAHVVTLNCQAGNANAELTNDGSTTDLWVNNDATYVGTNWLSANSPSAATSGTTWHLGKGSGTSATVITVTVSTEATGSSCIFQGFAQVMTS
jgi:hypothetical protein